MGDIRKHNRLFGPLGLVLETLHSVILFSRDVVQVKDVAGMCVNAVDEPKSEIQSVRIYCSEIETLNKWRKKTVLSATTSKAVYLKDQP